MPDALLEAVLRVAAEAGRLAVDKACAGVARWEKAGGEPVCEADLAVDAFLWQRLGALDPEAGWLSEESVDDPIRLERERVWVVDPIDGTRDYLRGRPGWAVSIALIERGRPVLAVLEAPERGETWVATAGGPATRNGRELRVTPRDRLVGARVPADGLSRRNAGFYETVAKPNSIALRIALVAAGEADLVATMRWGHEWDVAAAALIAERAGAVVTDALGAAIDYNSPAAEMFGVLTTAPGIHDAALARLNDEPGFAAKLRRE